MSAGAAVAAALAAALTAWIITGLVRPLLPIDVPGQRSSHSAPVARGGGLAIVAVTLMGVLVAAMVGATPRGLALAELGGGTLVAVIGWVDDRHGLPVANRLVAQTVAALWAVWWLGPESSADPGHGLVALGWAGKLVATLSIVWATNLFNFMDGIDGLAGIEAVCLGLGGGLLLWRSGHPEGVSLPMVLAGASLGFLIWNWAPARLFMGDTGSGFLGYALAVLALWSDGSGGPSLAVWTALAMVFVFDATVTLIRRGWRHELLTTAHRSHAYQRLAGVGWSHGVVSTLVLGLNLAILAVALLAPAWALGVAVVVVAGAYWLVERLNPM